MTVEENLLMGGFLKDRPAEAKAAAEMVFDKYSRLADRRQACWRFIRRGTSLARNFTCFVMQPQVLLVDEPSIGLGRVSSIWCLVYSVIFRKRMVKLLSWWNKTLEGPGFCR